MTPCAIYPAGRFFSCNVNVSTVVCREILAGPSFPARGLALSLLGIWVVDDSHTRIGGPAVGARGGAAAGGQRENGLALGGAGRSAGAGTTGPANHPLARPRHRALSGRAVDPGPGAGRRNDMNKLCPLVPSLSARAPAWRLGEWLCPNPPCPVQAVGLRVRAAFSRHLPRLRCPLCLHLLQFHRWVVVAETAATRTSAAGWANPRAVPPVEPG
jgi:hypothetical protein